MRNREILLVNPWIHDFAAYDMWARPLGLLCLAGALRAAGFAPRLLDCTDRHHPSVEARWRRGREFGRGKYPSEIIAKPKALAWMPRAFKRYGIAPTAFDAELERLPEPRAVLVTSRMTYWYTGVREAIARVRARWPRAPVALGGVWPTLYPAHAARLAGADALFAGEGENQLLEWLEGLPGQAGGAPTRFDLERLDDLPAPAYDLLTDRAVLPLLTSRGCPRRCTYCATNLLYAGYRRRAPERVAKEILELARRFGARDFAFYDDALLLDAERGIKPLLRRIAIAGPQVRFHTPNGIHCEEIDPELADLLRQTGFRSLRLSLETASGERRRSLRRETGVGHFLEAVRRLRAAGFEREELGVYLMCGLPGQSEEEVRAGLELILEAGAKPLLVEYSPLPGTAEYEKARRACRLPLDDEPLLCNNSVFHRISTALPDGAVARLRRELKVLQRTHQG